MWKSVFIQILTAVFVSYDAVVTVLLVLILAVVLLSSANHFYVKSIFAKFSQQQFIFHRCWFQVFFCFAGCNGPFLLCSVHSYNCIVLPYVKCNFCS